MAQRELPLDATRERDETRHKKLQTPVRELGLAVRMSDALEQHGVLLLGDLLKMRREDLLAIPGSEPYCVDRMRESFGEMGLWPIDTDAHVAE